MHSKDQKLAVLHQLSLESHPISLPYLIQKLGQNYAERSVRRWLSEMVKEGIVQRTGQKRGAKYLVIQRDHRIHRKANSCFSNESKKIIEEVRRPIYERPPVSYAEYWLDNYVPNVTFYVPLESQKQLHALGNRSRREDPAGTYAHQIFNRLLIDLSYNSSRLEGNTYSILDTQRLLLEGTSAEGKLDEEKIMILNHKDAIRYLVDNAFQIEMTEQTLFTLHYLLSDGLVETQYAGKIRDYGVRIAGSTYIPFEKKDLLEIHFKKIINKAAQIQNPYEQSFFLLTHLTYLQAFSDVNKRTARLSANISLIKQNLVPLSFNDVEREDYISAVIAIYECQDIRPLLDLYLFSYMRTCALYDTTIKSMGFDEIRVRYRQQRKALLRDVIQKKIPLALLKNHITSEMPQSIKEEEKQSFLNDLLEDLRELDFSRIAGLSITEQQLLDWKKEN